jgi:hypothetical protein
MFINTPISNTYLGQTLFRETHGTSLYLSIKKTLTLQKSRVLQIQGVKQALDNAGDAVPSAFP